MPSAFHTFKLVAAYPMATTRPAAPVLPPSTSSSNNDDNPTTTRPSPINTLNHPHDSSASSTPTSETRMNPPNLPRSLMTPVREMREASASSTNGSTRKPRQNLEERDHILMVQQCLAQKDSYKEGSKTQFWAGVGGAFQAETGKVLAQLSATVGRLIEARRRQLVDWESGVLREKPGGQLNDLLDEWMEFLKTEIGDAETERMRQVEARRKVEDERKETRRQTLTSEQVPGQQQSPDVVRPPPRPPQPMQGLQPVAQMVQTNGEDINGFGRPPKRRRPEGEMQQPLPPPPPPQHFEQHHYPPPWHMPPQPQPQPQPQHIEPLRRVVVEGAMSKEDWREIMGNDARLRALETKIDKIEVLVSQNNKLLHQLLSSQRNELEGRASDEERVPVHLDEEFERDYL